MLLAGLLPCAPQAAASTPAESAVKAAYIYRFLEYVSWPPEALKFAEDPFVIGTTQDDDVTAELRRIARERTMLNRKLVVTVVKAERDPAVHVLYVAPPDLPRFAKAFEPRRPVLVVADSRDALEQGAMINFVASEGRIKFEVAIDAAQRAGLTISARLLAIAIRVKKSEFQGNGYALLPATVPRRESCGPATVVGAAFHAARSGL